MTPAVTPTEAPPVSAASDAPLERAIRGEVAQGFPRGLEQRRWAWAAFAAAAFRAGYAVPVLWWGVLLVPALLWPLSSAPTWRRAFYPALLAGYAMYAPQLGFFHTIFGLAAAVLWLVLALWLALHVVLVRAVRVRWGRRAGLLALPVVWTGLEYFRSELYYLRFSWLTPGLALPSAETVTPLGVLGVYGVGFFVAAAGALAWGLGRRWPVAGVGAAGLWALAALPELVGHSPGQKLRVAGLQVEGVVEEKLPGLLEDLRQRHLDAELFVLPEYAIQGEPAAGLLEWCREHRRWLVVGGKRLIPGGGYFNTAFVISPEGRVVFEQAKSVPIQFFDDGRPAPRQALWNSPWGPLGLCICYDLSYTRVTDRLAAAGARALIVPTLDEVSWGAAQHRLHGRVAPVRAAEYGIPIIRIASSGISQIVARDGRVTASAPFSEEVRGIVGDVLLSDAARRPLVRWLGPACLLGTAAFLVALLAKRPRRQAGLPPPAPPATGTSPPT
ncbi:MAG: nitrilase-related carbon-nitrogen hydrolase [Limisphaerales bacterium]